MYMAWAWHHNYDCTWHAHVQFLTEKHMFVLVGFSADCLATTHVVAWRASLTFPDHVHYHCSLPLNKLFLRLQMLTFQRSNHVWRVLPFPQINIVIQVTLLSQLWHCGQIHTGCICAIESCSYFGAGYCCYYAFCVLVKVYYCLQFIV